MSSYSHLHQHFPNNGSLPSQSRSSSPTYLSRNDTYVSKSQLQPSTSNFTNQKHTSNWPETPQNLQKSTSEICLNVVIELLLVLISLPLLALAIAVVYYKDKKVVDSEWDVFKQIINSVSQSNSGLSFHRRAMFHLTSDTSNSRFELTHCAGRNSLSIYLRPRCWSHHQTLRFIPPLQRSIPPPPRANNQQHHPRIHLNDTHPASSPQLPDPFFPRPLDLLTNRQPGLPRPYRTKIHSRDLKFHRAVSRHNTSDKILLREARGLGRDYRGSDQCPICG